MRGKEMGAFEPVFDVREDEQLWPISVTHQLVRTVWASDIQNI